MEGVWGIFVNKPLGFQIQFNMGLDFKKDLILPLKLKAHSNIVLTLWNTWPILRQVASYDWLKKSINKGQEFHPKSFQESVRLEPF